MGSSTWGTKGLWFVQGLQILTFKANPVGSSWNCIQYIIQPPCSPTWRLAAWAFAAFKQWISFQRGFEKKTRLTPLKDQFITIPPGIVKICSTEDSWRTKFSFKAGAWQLTLAKDEVLLLNKTRSGGHTTGLRMLKGFVPWCLHLRAYIYIFSK